MAPRPARRHWRAHPYPPPQAGGGPVRRLLARAVIRLIWPYLLDDLASWRLREAHIWGDPARVRVAEDVNLNNALFSVQSGTITVERTAFFGTDVCLLAGSHDATRFGLERQAAIPDRGRDIVIAEGAWLTSNVVVVGPVRIGRHAVVYPGSVVVSDVPDHARVAGVPGRVVGWVEP